MTLEADTDLEMDNMEMEKISEDGSRRADKEGLVFPTSPNQNRVFFNLILLNEGISVVNFYTQWAFVMYAAFIMIGGSTLEPQYISYVLKIPDSELGTMTSMLYFSDYSIRLVFALGYGVLIDSYGRRFVMTYCIVLTSLGYLLIPIIGTSMFPGYFLGKAVFSSGIIGLQMLPFAADYVHNSTKGIMTGLTFGVGFVGCAIAAGYAKLMLYLGLSYEMIYWSMSATILIGGFLIWFGIKGGNQYYRVQIVNEEGEAVVYGSNWYELKKAFREIPWITISVFFGILGNTDLYIVTTGLVIWIKSLVGPGEDPTSVTTDYQIVFFALSVFITVYMAIKIDKIPHMKLIFPILICSTLGFITVLFIDDAHSKLFYVFFVVEGLTLPGILLFSTYLAVRYYPSHIRGMVSGITNGVCFIGAIIILSLGGYLHDTWKKNASFLLYWGLLTFTLVSVSIIYKFWFTKELEEKMKLVNQRRVPKAAMV